MTGRQSDADSQGESSADDGSGHSWAERVLVIVSIAFTLLLFSYAVWQGVTTPAAADPSATVVGTETLDDGRVEVTVAVRNDQNVGLVSLTATVDCGSPPPELRFEHLPASDERQGRVVCPPGTENPSASVTSWAEA